MLEKRIRDLGMNPEDYWWYCDLRRYGSYEEFPEAFKRYVEFIERQTGVPVKIISVGPDRGETIVR